ncbi:LuxR family transcriptional regulator [Dictyobacter alpinus]|uniref:LuxR family transcriptional regulator n=1 Tax=Dictyobacter alpinus TaxID=2014873 RepID=A0A402BF67_9CHLR|nr:LuxR C-terminal-related transcriptional regulator [Dictyobacter alpinus]GCE30033.1 LuxR family transcriptional regulator [Dictyobacter alpinus]
MPRYARAQVRWSEQTQTYMLSTGNQANGHVLTGDWLEAHSSFSFHSRQGAHYTIRKQRGQRGGSYWYAYRRLCGRLVKRYLGKEASLTFARLEEVAYSLEHAPERQPIQTEPAHLPTREATPALPADAHPLLLSRLSQPRLPAFLLERPRLFALLDAGRAGALTLLSAPAGFGKTTLVSQWITARRTQADFPPVAWITLERSENDPRRFWRYLLAACQAFETDLTQVHRVFTDLTLQPPFLPTDFSGWLTTFLNALAQAPARGILILEDYQVITEDALHEALAFFLRHLPTTLHVLMLTRSDPPLPLANLRARNVLTDVRADDLRFSWEETSTFLRQSLPFPLSAPLIQRLHVRLEGWGVGLHLAKLALQRATSSTQEEQLAMLLLQNSVITQDYFITEILYSQPESVQRFLLQTSFLPRLTAALCDAVTEQERSQDLLTSLEQANLFLERLDDDAHRSPSEAHQWYRYHTLFADALSAEAARRWSKEVLHDIFARASHWYERSGALHEAIDAAFSAQDQARAALLLTHFIEEQTVPGEVQEAYTLLGWFEQLSEALFEQHPVLCLSYATVMLWQNPAWQPDSQSITAMEYLLQQAEDHCRREQHFSLLGELLAFRALLALRRGEMQVAVAYARQAQVWLPQTQDIWRGLSATIVATQWIVSGRFPQALSVLQDAHERLARANNHLFYQAATIRLAQVHFELGELQQAASFYRQALEVSLPAVDGHLTAPLANWHCTALTGYAALCYERNELARATQLLQETIALSQAYTFLDHKIHALLLLARIQQAQGDTGVAQQRLTDLLERVPAFQNQLVQDIRTAQASLALLAGDYLTVQQWIFLHTPPADFTRRVEDDVLQARWLRIQGEEAEATHQLEQLLLATQEAGHMRGLLHTKVEMALSASGQKHRAEALDLLREVLVLALPHHLIRLFLDAGEPMVMLLRSLLSRCHDQPLRAYIHALLRAFPVPQPGEEADRADLLIEPLSPQEVRVLRLLAEHRTNAEIATALVVSINTVRTQVQSIYTKLGVHRRSEALAVAHDLQLLS